MKTFVLGLGIAFVLAHNSPAAAGQTRLAPADDYFGHYHMSVLGVRNAIKDLGMRQEQHLSNDEQVLYSKLLIVEDSLNDWRARYPNDTWIPRLGLALAKVWTRLNFADAGDHAGVTLGWVIANYPSSEIAPWAVAFRNATRVGAGTTRWTAVSLPIPIESRY